MAVADSMGGLSTGARTPEGLQRISEANLKHGRQTKDKLEANRHTAKVGRRVLDDLKRLENQLVDAGLVPFD
jgi:flagellar biosynthesis regulator FlaF